jgi:ABC-2 type transport system permease protein
LSNLRAKTVQTLSLIDFELRKLFRRKLAHAGVAVSLFLTALAAVGFAMRQTRHPDKELGGRLVNELFNGVAFSQTVLLPGIYVLLPMVLGIFAAASFAGEYGNGHLRTLAIRPVSRWRMFVAKFVALCVYSYLLLGILLVVSYSIGAFLFGPSGDVIVFGPAFLGRSGKIFILSADIAFERLFLSYFFAGDALISLSAMFMMFSAIFRKPAIATVVPLGVYYTSYILDALPFMESLQRFLPTRYLMVWKYAMAPSVDWGGMLHDGGFLFIYTFAYLVVGGVCFARSEL